MAIGYHGCQTVIEKLLDHHNKVIIFSLKLLYVCKHFLDLMNILQILEELELTKL